MKNKGFTLLELLISIALISILLVGIAGLASRFVGNMSANGIKQNELENIYSTFHIISQDVASYHNLFAGSLNEVQMLTAQKNINGTETKSGQFLISYKILQQNGKYILYRKIKDNLSKTSGIETEIISMEEIIFSFVGESLEKNFAWIAKSRGSAPLALKIKIKDSAGRYWERIIPFMVRFNDG